MSLTLDLRHFLGSQSRRRQKGLAAFIRRRLRLQTLPLRTPPRGKELAGRCGRQPSSGHAGRRLCRVRCVGGRRDTRQQTGHSSDIQGEFFWWIFRGFFVDFFGGFFCGFFRGFFGWFFRGFFGWFFRGFFGEFLVNFFADFSRIFLVEFLVEFLWSFLVDFWWIFSWSFGGVFVDFFCEFFCGFFRGFPFPCFFSISSSTFDRYLCRSRPRLSVELVIIRWCWRKRNWTRTNGWSPSQSSIEYSEKIVFRPEPYALSRVSFGFFVFLIFLNFFLIVFSGIPTERTHRRIAQSH